MLFSAAVYLVFLLVEFAMIYGAGRVLARAGRFTHTFRALAFAQVVSLVNLAALYPPLAGPARLVAFVLGLVAIWVGASAAHKLQGWRAALFPLLALLLYAFGAVLVFSLLGGAQFTVQALLANFGLAPH